MNKREAVLSLLDANKKPAYTPAAFFLHFDPEYRSGQPAVDRHLEYFRATGMDFVKIQYEQNFPYLDWLQKPEDWANMPFYGEEFYEAPLGVVEGLVKAAKPEALVVMTLYSPFMLAFQSSGGLVNAHVRENPQAFKKGMQVIAESLTGFVRGCIRRGIDGFYVSTQGGEKDRFDNTNLFQECVKPYDLAIWDEIQGKTIFNILHVCDYMAKYSDYQAFLDYPGQVVNCSLKLETKELSSKEISAMFGRPFMGGMDRLGIIASGSLDQVRRAAEEALSQAPERFILAADCTVPGETPWENLKTAIDTAHNYRKG